MSGSVAEKIWPHLYPARYPSEKLWSLLRPRRVRSLRQFAEEEIVIPHGAAPGPFRCSFMPWTGVFLDAVDDIFHHRTTLRRVFASGPVQDGKTTIVLVIPAMYCLFELRWNIIIGAPKSEIAQAKFEEEIKPMITASRFADLLPKKGAGSRGGRSDALTFANGVSIRFMGGGGGDEQRSSFTAPIVFVTEVDKMDEPGQVSREADPVTQLEARTAGYGTAGILVAECTMSTEYGRVNQEITVKGTDTAINIPCPHCGTYIVPERDNFTGWQDARDILEAHEKGIFICPECSTPWTEADRLQALKSPVLAASGQKVEPDGSVTGDMPRTNTFGFRWNAMHSALKSMSFIAEKEWEADRSERTDPKKELMQFTWALPWEENIEDISGLSRELIYSKISRHPRGTVPPRCIRLTAFVDIGLRVCWYAVCAWRENAEGFVIDYGAWQVPHPDHMHPEDAAILTALRTLRDDVFSIGYRREDGGLVAPDLVLVDSGYKAEITYAFTGESGRYYFPSKGLGTKQRQERFNMPKARSKNLRPGHEYFISVPQRGVRLVNMNADYWKREVHEGLHVLAGSPGSLSLFDAENRAHRAFADQIMSERQIEEFRPGKGNILYWAQEARHNHYLDCLYGCLCAAGMLNIRRAEDTQIQRIAKHYDEKREEKKPQQSGSNWKIGR